MEEEKRGFALFFFLSLCLKCGKERDEIGRQKRVKLLTRRELNDKGVSFDDGAEWKNNGEERRKIYIYIYKSTKKRTMVS